LAYRGEQYPRQWASPFDAGWQREKSDRFGPELLQDEELITGAKPVSTREVRSPFFLRDPIDGKTDHFARILEAQLLFDVSAMGFDCFHAEMEFGGDPFGS
jgi:hypothetical protein